MENLRRNNTEENGVLSERLASRSVLHAVIGLLYTYSVRLALRVGSVLLPWQDSMRPASLCIHILLLHPQDFGAHW
jgi:hypothetical protein